MHHQNRISIKFPRRFGRHGKRTIPEYVIVDRLRVLVDAGVDIDRLPGYLTISQLLLMSVDQLKAACAE